MSPLKSQGRVEALQPIRSTTQPDIGAVLEKVRVHIFERRIRVKDTFLDFDPRRSRSCTRDQFARAVNQLIPTLSAAEITSLVEHYSEQGPHVGKPQVVRYLPFVKAIDTVFVVHDLERIPTARVPKPGSMLKATASPRPPLGDDEVVSSVLKKLALLTKTRGYDFRDCFADCERGDSTSLITPRFSGKITPGQFLQHFPFIKDFTEAEVQALLHRYGTESGDVNFQTLDKELRELMEAQDAAARPQLGARRTPTLGVSRKAKRLQDPSDLAVLERLKAHVHERRLRVSAHFRDFDRLRRGYCSLSHVRTVFTVLDIAASERDVEAIGRLYRVGEGSQCMFAYGDFCDDILDVPHFPAPFAESMSRMTMTPLGTLSTGIDTGRKCYFDSEDSEAKLEEIEVTIARRVHKRQVAMKMIFRDFDKIHTGRVSRTQFLRIMDSLRCGLNEEQTEFLLGFYGDDDLFNYLDFCTSVEARASSQQLETSAYYSVRPVSRYFDKSGQVMPMLSEMSVASDMMLRPFTR